MTVQIVLAHPKYKARLSVERKLTRKMPKWIADLFKHDLVAGSLPPADIRQPVTLCATVSNPGLQPIKLKSKSFAELSHVSNIQLGERQPRDHLAICSAILDKLLKIPQISFDLEPLVYKSLKKTS